MNINLKQIGIIHSPFRQLNNIPVQPIGARDIVATVEIKEEFFPLEHQCI